MAIAFAPKVNRHMCFRWLLLFVLVAMTGAMFIGAALPLDSTRHIDFSKEIQLKPAYEIEASLALKDILFSARKLSHVFPLGLLFIVSYFLATKRRLRVALFVTTMVSILIEITQGFIATRSAKVHDLAALVIAIPLAYFVIKLWKTLHFRQELLNQRYL